MPEFRRGMGFSRNAKFVPEGEIPKGVDVAEVNAVLGNLMDSLFVQRSGGDDVANVQKELPRKRSWMNRMVTPDAKLAQEALSQYEAFMKKEPLVVRIPSGELRQVPEYTFDEATMRDIRTLCDALASFLASFGARTLATEDLLRKVHFVPFEAMRFLGVGAQLASASGRRGNALGGFRIDSGMIIVPAIPTMPLRTLRTLLHEIIHAQSFNSFTLHRPQKDGTVHASLRRGGMNVFLRGEGQTGSALDEALTEELVDWFLHRWISEDARISEELRKQVAELPPGNIYLTQRSILDTLLQTMQDRGVATDRDDALASFFTVKLTGNMLPLARRMAETFQDTHQEGVFALRSALRQMDDGEEVR